MSFKNRNAILTIYTDDADYLSKVLDTYEVGKGDPRVVHFRGQWERCPTTSRLHIHLYVQAKCPLTIGQYQTAMGAPNCNVKAVGKDNGASDYVLKDATRYSPDPAQDNRRIQVEWGELKKKVGRPKSSGNALDDLVEAVVEGQDPVELADNHPEAMIRFSTGAIRTYQLLHNSQPRFLTENPTFIVHYGPTGTGKSHAAFNTFLKDDGTLDSKAVYVKSASTGKWFDGYFGQKAIIIEEFRSQIPFAELLTLVDKYPMTIEYKGGSCQIQCSEIHITTPTHPSKWYTNLAADDGRLDQLKRRITSLLYYTKRGEEPEDQTDQKWPHEEVISDYDPSYDQFS